MPKWKPSFSQFAGMTANKSLRSDSIWLPLTKNVEHIPHMTSLKHSFISLLLILLAQNAQASTDDTNDQLQEKSQEISFQVESSLQVENDEMLALLAIEDEGRDPSALANNINRIMANALKILKREKSIKSETGTYSTYPVYNKNRIVNWRISQQLRLRSKNFEAMNKMIGKLQDNLNVKSISFGISKDAQAKAEETLIQSAIKKFTKRANLIKTSLNIPNYKIKRLDIHTQPQQPPMPIRSIRMEVASAPIATAGGESNVTVSIHAVIDVSQ